MGFFGVAATAWRTAHETHDAVTAALRALDAGHGPVAAARAFCQATPGTWDDGAEAELEALVRRGLVVADGVIAAAAVVAQHAPAVEAAVRSAAAWIAEEGWRLGAVRSRLRVWMEEA